MTRKPVRCLSHALTGVQSPPAAHNATQGAREQQLGRAMGPVELTAASHRLDGTPDFSTWI